MPLDVTDRAANEAVVAQVEAEHGRLDAAYLNAGHLGGEVATTTWTSTSSSASSTIDLFGVVYGAQAARPAIERAGGGAIVVTASLAGLSPMAGDPGVQRGEGRGDRLRPLDGAAAGRRGDDDHRDLPRLRRHRDHRPRSASQFTAAGFPVLTADEVADAMVQAWTAGEPGAAYVVQPGVGVVPYRFKGVPSAKTATGETAVVPEALRPPSMR